MNKNTRSKKPNISGAKIVCNMFIWLAVGAIAVMAFQWILPYAIVFVLGWLALKVLGFILEIELEISTRSDHIGNLIMGFPSVKSVLKEREKKEREKKGSAK